MASTPIRVARAGRLDGDGAGKVHVVLVQAVGHGGHDQPLARRAAGGLQAEGLDDDVVGVEGQVRPVILDGAEGQQHGRLAYSAGFNAAGISLTGNEVTSNDVRPGVPRLLTVRAILAARRLEEALDACLHPRRASSYNNVVADAHGEVYSMEGSVTDCEAIYIEGDVLAQDNLAAHGMPPALGRSSLRDPQVRHRVARLAACTSDRALASLAA